LGNGDGSFGANKNYTTDNDPLFVALGDFNRDGKLDIATANDSNTDTVSVLLNLAPDLAMSKGHSGSFVVGSNGVYTFTVSNIGDMDISGPISVTDTLPIGLSFVSATGANWSCSAVSQTVTCNAGQLASGATSTITLTVAVGYASFPSVTNTAMVSNASDTNAANNMASDPTTIINVNLPPSIGTLTPASGTSAADATVSFRTSYTDANVYAQLATGYFLVNTALSGTNAAYGYYDQNANAFYWRNDANTASLGPCTPGQPTVLENSYSKLNCAASTVSGSGTALTVTWNVTFKTPFETSAVKNIYLRAIDDAAASSGWVQRGTWQVSSTAGPSIVTVRENKDLRLTKPKILAFLGKNLVSWCLGG
jgi:uncharacterized repeat protein (TIGR01451 family)